MPHDEDTFPFQDPFGGGEVPPERRETVEQTNVVYGEFPENRWRTVGAEDSEIELLRKAHDGRNPTERAQEGMRVASLSNGDLAEELEVVRDAGEDPAESEYNGTVAEVKDLVDEDPEEARRALRFEKSPFGKGRTTLIRYLEEIVGVPGETHPRNPQTGLGTQAEPGAQGTGGSA